MLSRGGSQEVCGARNKSKVPYPAILGRKPAGASGGTIRMTDYWTWWILAAVLIGAEIVTGTFYLLVVGIAFAVGGFLAVFGMALPLQLAVAGIVAVVGTMIAHRWRARRVPPPEPSLDLGQSVRVLDWKSDGSARVNYRGTQWNAELAESGVTRAETMYIVGTRGSTLLIADQRRSE